MTNPLAVTKLDAALAAAPTLVGLCPDGASEDKDLILFVVQQLLQCSGIDAHEIDDGTRCPRLEVVITPALRAWVDMLRAGLVEQYDVVMAAAPGGGNNERPGWSAQTIMIRTMDGVISIAAHTYGEFAVHGEALADGSVSADRWSLTHLPSGIRFRSYFLSFSTAAAAAEQISTLRDWADFDLKSATNELKQAVSEICAYHGGCVDLREDENRRRSREEAARRLYATDLNGYAPKPPAGGDGGAS